MAGTVCVHSPPKGIYVCQIINNNVAVPKWIQKIAGCESS